MPHLAPLLSRKFLIACLSVAVLFSAGAATIQEPAPCECSSVGPTSPLIGGLEFIPEDENSHPMPGLRGYAAAKVTCESKYAVTSDCRACGTISLEHFEGPTGTWVNKQYLSFPRSVPPLDCDPETPADSDFIVEVSTFPIWFGYYKMTFEFQCEIDGFPDDSEVYTKSHYVLTP